LTIKFRSRQKTKIAFRNKKDSIQLSKNSFISIPQTGGFLAIQEIAGGADRVRTDGLRLAKPALSQLSYSPMRSDGGPKWI
jgi:hypothetical protein